jgi:hypothetical protein
MEREMRNVRHLFTFTASLCTFPRYCEERWVTRCAKSPASTPKRAGLCRILEMDFREFVY